MAEQEKSIVKRSSALARFDPEERKELVVRGLIALSKVIAKKGLKGLVTAVDLKNKLASISTGTADGVKEGMKFQVTRGDKFICDIIIIDTDAEDAVGVLELLDFAKEQPKPGDTLTTNL